MAVRNKTQLDEDLQYSRIGDRPPTGRGFPVAHNYQNHPNVFKPGLGTVKGITAKLEMKPDARPKFCKARPVPYALQEAVEAEYNRLESEGIVKRVEFSEWATPMVHDPKQMETHVLMMIMLLLSTPSFTSLSIQFLSRRMSS